MLNRDKVSNDLRGTSNHVSPRQLSRTYPTFPVWSGTHQWSRPSFLIQSYPWGVPTIWFHHFCVPHHDGHLLFTKRPMQHLWDVLRIHSINSLLAEGCSTSWHSLCRTWPYYTWNSWTWCHATACSLLLLLVGTILPLHSGLMVQACCWGARYQYRNVGGTTRLQCWWITSSWGDPSWFSCPHSTLDACFWWQILTCELNSWSHSGHFSSLLHK